jgi:hypothetical protein
LCAVFRNVVFNASSSEFYPFATIPIIVIIVIIFVIIVVFIASKTPKTKAIQKWFVAFEKRA